MTIQRLRQEAKDLREHANRVLLYDEKYSLDDAWRRLEELFRQVPLVLGSLVENSEIILLGGESLRKANKGQPPTE